MTTAVTVDRDELIAQREADTRRLFDLHEEAAAELTAAGAKVTAAENQYAELLIAPEASSAALTKAFRAVESAKEAREALKHRVDAIHAKGVEVEEERNSLITARMREEQQKALAEVYREFDAANAEVLERIRATYRSIPADVLQAIGNLAEVLWGAVSLPYTIRIVRLQQRLAALGEVGVGGTVPTLNPYAGGIVRLMIASGDLS